MVINVERVVEPRPGQERNSEQDYWKKRLDEWMYIYKRYTRILEGWKEENPRFERSNACDLVQDYFYTAIQWRKSIVFFAWISRSKRFKEEYMEEDEAYFYGNNNDSFLNAIREVDYAIEEMYNVVEDWIFGGGMRLPDLFARVEETKKYHVEVLKNEKMYSENPEEIPMTKGIILKIGIPETWEIIYFTKFIVYTSKMDDMDYLTLLDRRNERIEYRKEKKRREKFVSPSREMVDEYEKTLLMFVDANVERVKKSLMIWEENQKKNIMERKEVFYKNAEEEPERLEEFAYTTRNAGNLKTILSSRFLSFPPKDNYVLRTGGPWELNNFQYDDLRANRVIGKEIIGLRIKELEDKREARGEKRKRDEDDDRDSEQKKKRVEVPL